MAVVSHANGYAQAIVSIAEAEGLLDTVRDELLVFQQALVAEPELRDALADPGKEASNKATLIANLLGGKSNPLTARLLSVVAFQGRARELVEIIEEVANLVAARSGSAVAEVRTAVALDEKQVEKLTQAIAAATGKKVAVNVIVDPSVLGGLVVRVGDQVFDASVRNRLSSLRDKIGSR